MNTTVDWATGVYFVTNINDFDFQLSYSASDVFAGQYIDLVTDLAWSISL